MTAERSEFANSGNTGNISIAIDGPAGAGKSTIAKEISKRLSITYGISSLRIKGERILIRY